MKKGGKLFLTLASIGVVVISFFFTRSYKNDFSILETSVLETLRGIMEKNVEPADLNIEKVSLKKIANPSENFNYYKYQTTLIIKNEGGNLFNSQVALRAEPNQKNTLLKNNSRGFTLKADESYIVDDYEVLLDADYNGGNITFEIELIDDVDYYEKNNKFEVAVFEAPAKIENLNLLETRDDGTLVLDFNSAKFSTKKHDFEIRRGERLRFEADKEEYKETDGKNAPYAYKLLKIDEDFLKQEFDIQKTNEAEAHFVKTNGEKEEFIFIKAINPETGFYAVSDVIHLGPQEEMTRVQFAKLFVEYADVEMMDTGETTYTDISEDEWYSPYLRTLFNLGLTSMDSTRFNPNEKISREEVVKIVVDYFDGELLSGEAAAQFEDVSSESGFAPYFESFHQTAGADFDNTYFYPQNAATKDFLKYLINEYSKSN